ncbi:hypothetical protein WJX77_007704 [Trebouxia sp. C0004]
MDIHLDITQHLLLWQISQLNYICGSVHIDLQQLVSTINSLFGFLCEDNQALIVDALPDEAGDWGYLACRSVSTAAALEAAAEDVDINTSGYLIRIQSLNAANLMYSSAQLPQISGSRLKPVWTPCAAYAVYPDHYPPRAHSRFPKDYLPADELDQLQHPAAPQHADLLSFDQQAHYRLADTSIGYADISAFALGMANPAEAGNPSGFSGGKGGRGKDQAAADASELCSGPEVHVHAVAQAQNQPAACKLPKANRRSDGQQLKREDADLTAPPLPISAAATGRSHRLHTLHRGSVQITNVNRQVNVEHADCLGSASSSPMPAAPPPIAEASPPQADPWSPATMTPSPTGITQPTTAVPMPQLPTVAQITSSQRKTASRCPAASPAANASPLPAYFPSEGTNQSASPAVSAAGRLSPRFAFAVPKAAPSSPTAFASPPQADCLFPTPCHTPRGPSPNGLPSRVKRFDPSLDQSCGPPHHAVGPNLKSSWHPGSFASPVSLHFGAAASSPISFVCGGAIHAPAAGQQQALPPDLSLTTLPPAGAAAAAAGADSLFDAFGKAAAAVPAALVAADKASEGVGEGEWSLELPARMTDRHSGLHQQETSPACTVRQRLFKARQGSRQLRPQSPCPDQGRRSSRRGKVSRHSDFPLGALWSPDKLRYPSSRTARHHRTGRVGSLSETSSSRNLSQCRGPARSESAGTKRVRSRPAGSERPSRRVQSSSSPSKGKFLKRNTSPASSEPYGQAMGACRSRQLSRRHTRYSMFPSSFDSLTRRQQMLQAGKSRDAPGKHVVFPKAASSRRSRPDSRLNHSSKHESRSHTPPASPTRGRPLSRSSRSSNARKRSPSLSFASPSRHKCALGTSKSTRKRGCGLSQPRYSSPSRDLQHLSSSGRRRTGGVSNRPSCMSPDDPSPISGIQGKDLPFRGSYPPIVKDPYLPFPQSDHGRYQPARISPDYPYGNRGHSEQLHTRPRSPMPSLLSSDISLNEFKNAKRAVRALSPHGGPSPAPKKTDGGFSLPPTMVSSKDHMLPKSTNAKAHRGKHDIHKHSSRDHKHAKAHRDKSSTEQHIGPDVDSDLLTLRGCALAVLSSSTAAGESKLQQPQEQEPQQQQQQQQQAGLPVVSAADDQQPTLAIDQLHAQQQGNWQTAFAKGPGQERPCAGAAPDSPEVCQRSLGLFAPEYAAQAGAYAQAFPSSLQAPSPQPQSQLITSTKGYAEPSPTPANAATSDWHVTTSARLAGKSGLCATQFQGSPDAGTITDHDMQNLDMQCITKPRPAVMQATPIMATTSMTNDKSHGEVPWPEFQKAYLQLCTQECYIAQCWNLDRQLGTEERAMLHAFQQQVFHMVNVSLIDDES